MPTPPRPDAAPRVWRTLRRPVAPAFEHARLTLHHALQLLASFGQAQVEPRADDSHRSATWDGDLDTFRSEPSPGGIQAVLTVGGFTLVLERDRRTIAALELRGRTLEEARRWLTAELSKVAPGNPDPAWPEYEMPTLPEGRDGRLDRDGASLGALAAWYGNAALVLEAIAANTAEASPVRCWPHHFDLATLLTLPGARPDADAKHVGLGLSPGDASVTHPYYYVNAWPPPAPAALPALGGAGSWNTEGWIGALLTADEIVASGDGDRQREVVRTFLVEAVEAMHAAVLEKP